MSTTREICPSFAVDGSAMIGTPLDIKGFPLQVSVTEPVAKMIPHLVYSAAGKLSLKQVANGGCVIGGGWPARQRPDGVLVTNTKYSGAEIRKELTPEQQRRFDEMKAEREQRRKERGERFQGPWRPEDDT